MTVTDIWRVGSRSYPVTQAESHVAGPCVTLSAAMNVLSRFVPPNSRIADFSRIYATHRPLVQRGLTAGFVLYVLLATYQRVAARPPIRGSKSVPARDGKPARVAVSIS